jgi:hypothetical protein
MSADINDIAPDGKQWLVETAFMKGGEVGRMVMGYCRDKSLKNAKKRLGAYLDGHGVEILQRVRDINNATARLVDVEPVDKGGAS